MSAYIGEYALENAVCDQSVISPKTKLQKFLSHQLKSAKYLLGLAGGAKEEADEEGCGNEEGY